MYNAQNKVKVGSDLGNCVRTDPGVSWECHWTLELRRARCGGGPYFDHADSFLAIIGGTGRCAQDEAKMLTRSTR